MNFTYVVSVRKIIARKISHKLSAEPIIIFNDPKDALCYILYEKYRPYTSLFSFYQSQNKSGNYQDIVISKIKNKEKIHKGELILSIPLDDYFIPYDKIEEYLKIVDDLHIGDCPPSFVIVNRVLYCPPIEQHLGKALRL